MASPSNEAAGGEGGGGGSLKGNDALTGLSSQGGEKDNQEGKAQNKRSDTRT